MTHTITLTWDSLFDFTIPVDPVQVPSTGSTTAYSATNAPERPIQPRYMVPDCLLPNGQSIITRVIQVLRGGLSTLSTLPRIPDFVNYHINTHCRTLANEPIYSEAGTSFLFYDLCKAAGELSLAIFSATGNDNARFSFQSAPQVKPQQRDGYFRIIDTETPALSNSVSVVCKMPNYLYSHGGRHGLQSRKRLRSQQLAKNEDAIAIKVRRLWSFGGTFGIFRLNFSLQLSLQIAHSESGRFGIIYTGHNFMLTELCKLKSFRRPNI